MKRNGVSLYEVCLVTFLVFWFLERIHVFAQLTPVVRVSGVNIGFALSRLAVFALIWFVMWYLDRNLQPMFVQGMRSHQGVARGVDFVILLVCLTLVFISFRVAYTASPYLGLMAGLVAVAAAYSFVTGGERPHTAQMINLSELNRELEVARDEPPVNDGEEEEQDHNAPETREEEGDSADSAAGA
jgi:hypothetical protein